MGSRHGWLPPPALSEAQRAALPAAIAKTQDVEGPAGATKTITLLVQLSTVVSVPSSTSPVQRPPGRCVKPSASRSSRRSWPPSESGRTWRRKSPFFPAICELIELLQPQGLYHWPAGRGCGAFWCSAASPTTLPRTGLVTRDQDNMKLMLQTYAEDLSCYPFAKLEKACRTWRRKSPFFPAICELIELLGPVPLAGGPRLWRLLVLRSVANNPAPDGPGDARMAA